MELWLVLIIGAAVFWWLFLKPYSVRNVRYEYFEPTIRGWVRKMAIGGEMLIAYQGGDAEFRLRKCKTDEGAFLTCSMRGAYSGENSIIQLSEEVEQQGYDVKGIIPGKDRTGDVLEVHVPLLPGGSVSQAVRLSRIEFEYFGVGDDALFEFSNNAKFDAGVLVSDLEATGIPIANKIAKRIGKRIGK